MESRLNRLDTLLSAAAQAKPSAPAANCRIVVVDDHPVFRVGIKELLSDDPHYRIVGEAGGEEEALAAIARFRPDVAIVDLGLAQGDGHSLMKRIPAASPATRVVVVSGHCTAAHISDAFRAGAKAYLAKDSACMEIRDALEAVSAGRTFIGSRAAESLAQGARGDAPLGGDPALLTDRQKQLLRLLARCTPPKVIAAELGISAKTVHAHRANIMNRLRLRNTHDLLSYAIHHGLIEG